MRTSRLPEGFEALEPYVDYWDVPTFQDRWHRRSNATMADIKGFYEVAQPLAEKALALAGEYPIDAMPEPVSRLFRMCLGMVSASISVEIQKSVLVPYSTYPHRARCVRGPHYWG